MYLATVKFRLEGSDTDIFVIKGLQDPPSVDEYIKINGTEYKVENVYCELNTTSPVPPGTVTNVSTCEKVITLSPV